jgi:hypothetical protein
MQLVTEMHTEMCEKTGLQQTGFGPALPHPEGDA